MIITFLALFNWTLWGALLVAMLYALITLFVGRSQRLRSGRALGLLMLGVGLLFLAASGTLLYWLAQKESLNGLTVIAVLLAGTVAPLLKQFFQAVLAHLSRSVRSLHTPTSVPNSKSSLSW